MIPYTNRSNEGKQSDHLDRYKRKHLLKFNMHYNKKFLVKYKQIETLT